MFIFVHKIVKNTSLHPPSIMKFIINSKKLHQQLGLIYGTVPTNPMLPILENFLFEIKDKRLQITASDLHITCITSIDVVTEEDVRLVMPAKIFMETLRSLPDQALTITFDPNSYNIEVSANKGRYKISSENPADFPESPKIESSTKIELNTKILNQAIVQTQYTISKDDLRPALNGVFIKIQPDNIIFVATDGYRLSKFEYSDVKYEIAAQEVIIPKKAIFMIKALLNEKKETIEMNFNPAIASFDMGEVQIISRLIDEQFPEYKNVIPESNNNHIRVNREEVRQILERMNIYANKHTSQMKLQVKGEEVTISAEDLDFSNEAKEVLNSVSHNGEDVEMGLNVTFLLDVFKILPNDDVLIQIGGKTQAVLFSPAEEENHTRILSLVMPIMINS